MTGERGGSGDRGGEGAGDGDRGGYEAEAMGVYGDQAYVGGFLL